MKLIPLVGVAVAGILHSAPVVGSGETAENNQALPSPNGSIVFPGYPDAYALAYRVHPDSYDPRNRKSGKPKISQVSGAASGQLHYCSFLA